jgi:hypothetical protein
VFNYRSSQNSSQVLNSIDLSEDDEVTKSKKVKKSWSEMNAGEKTVYCSVLEDSIEFHSQKSLRSI